MVYNAVRIDAAYYVSVSGDPNGSDELFCHRQRDGGCEHMEL